MKKEIEKLVHDHPLPAWFDDAKFGIFIHWGLYSVPAFAPAEADMIEMQKKSVQHHLKHNPYAEWYLNSLRIDGSPVQQYHEKTYGNKPYESFAEDFNSTLHKWHPGDWADLFKQSGAKYMVLVTKHHDGFIMWPTDNPNPLKPGYHATRDIPGELAREVRARGLRFGTYYSGTLDWAFQPEPIVDFASMAINGPTSTQYIEYANAHWHELIDRYGPSILWNDIGYPPGTDIEELFAYYYSKHPDGVINDRWMQVSPRIRGAFKNRFVRWMANGIAAMAIRSGKTSINPGHHHDFVTPEYKTYPDIRKKKWECTRGIGFSFGYNQVETDSQYMSSDALVHMLVDIVSKNGNLLLNIGPMADGTIPAIQRERVLALGKWLDANGDAIYGTRPWNRATTTTSENIAVRFTRKGDDLFMILLDTPEARRTRVKSLRLPAGCKLELLATGTDLKWTQDGPDVAFTTQDFPVGTPAHAIKASGACSPLTCLRA
ncbi:MAG: alpha-L-fucosidase [Candidatus Lokiarchaeota archaeon]|nr:alpha-L-fucosidase [Candidatus Lokiarchaeota archaeon]